ncbi:unnamed protein product [Arabidopsis arenosa]|uniref:Uncharacterized protein n=1 Tax=Arabidopsis arenosa TaxID=38785 RepID=A0A8S2AKL8_ARAAE|nr:unnamed protein product [Arabidopsis arenosa]
MDDSEEFSEVPDLSKWFSSYVYESPMLDTSDGLEFLGESKGTKEIELVSSQAKDMSQSQVEFSEDIMNLVVEDSEIDEDCSIWGKPKRKEPGIDLLVDCSFMLERQNPGARGIEVYVLLVSIMTIAGNIGRSAGSS